MNEIKETAVELELGPELSEILINNEITVEEIAERIGNGTSISQRPSKNAGEGAKSITPWLVLAYGASSVPAIWGLVTVIGMIFRKPIKGELLIEEPMIDAKGNIAKDPAGRPQTIEKRIPVFFDPKTGEIKANVDVDHGAKKLTLDLSSS